MKLSLVLTNDWELFGDGSGDYYEVQHKPTLDMLQVLKDHGAIMSFMAEVMQQLTFKKHSEDNGERSNIVRDWEKILQKAFLEGHDAQLHIHPQWMDAKFENNEWVLDNESWSLGEQTPEVINDLIETCKNYLETVIKMVDEKYNCTVFRAGAYYIEPSKNVLPYLINHNIISDTSVTRGFYVPNKYDYREVPSNSFPWNVGDLLTRGEKEYTGFLEFPIYSNEVLRSELLEKFLPIIGYTLFFGNKPSKKELKWAKKRDSVKATRYPVHRRPYKKHTKKDIKWYMSKILTKSNLQLDYDYIPATIFVELLKNIIDDRNNWEYFDKGFSIPVVASGHIKDAHTNENLKWILEKIEKLGGDVQYRTISEVSDAWHEKLR